MAVVPVTRSTGACHRGHTIRCGRDRLSFGGFSRRTLQLFDLLQPAVRNRCLVAVVGQRSKRRAQCFDITFDDGIAGPQRDLEVVGHGGIDLHARALG